jgi:hypothetical protein
MVAVPDRPLALGEIFAETIRLFGARLWPALGLGIVYSVPLAAAALINPALSVAVASFMFVAAFGVATRLVAGDSFAEAWGQVAVRLPTLVILALVVGLPFVLASTWLVLLIFAAFWVGLTGFAVPVALVEQCGEREGRLAPVAYAAERALALARVEFLHAVGVAAALLFVNFLVAIILGGALVGYADNGEIVAGVLSQIVLAPFFFIGLSVLYFEQRARLAAEPAPGAGADRA